MNTAVSRLAATIPSEMDGFITKPSGAFLDLWNSFLEARRNGKDSKERQERRVGRRGATSSESGRKAGKEEEKEENSHQ